MYYCKPVRYDTKWWFSQKLFDEIRPKFHKILSWGGGIIAQEGGSSVSKKKNELWWRSAKFGIFRFYLGHNEKSKNVNKISFAEPNDAGYVANYSQRTLFSVYKAAIVRTN